MTRNFGVMIESAGLAQRGTFVINPEAVSLSAKFMTKASAATPKNFSVRFRLSQFVEANPGMVCPAKWKPGQKTLKPPLIWSARSNSEIIRN